MYVKEHFHMNSLFDHLMATTDRITGRMGKVNTLVDALVERIAPTVNAAACFGGNGGYNVCQSMCQPRSECGGRRVRLYLFYGTTQWTQNNCGAGGYCTDCVAC
jgi:hypothetical protein